MTDTTLLVIDLQRGAFDGVRWRVISEPERLIGNALALLAAARASATPVVFIRHCEGAGEVFEEGTVHGELHEALAPQATEVVLKKYASSAFDNTTLEATLKTLGTKELVLCGLQSEFCVANTAKSALGLGLRVIVAADAHGTWPSGDNTADAISRRVNDELQAAGAKLQTTAELTRCLQEAQSY